jgi:TM2 domain-containing membrane protein YozV
MAVIVEALCGWFGFLGVGHLMRGYIVSGLALMVLWWLAILVLLFFVTHTLGAALCCMFPIWLLIPLLSASHLLALQRGVPERHVLSEIATVIDQPRIRCPECGQQNARIRDTCRNCGAKLYRTQ